MASTPDFLYEAEPTVHVQAGGTAEKSIQIAREGEMWWLITNLSHCREGINTDNPRVSHPA